jgi:FkbM family methyltransferase
VNTRLKAAALGIFTRFFGDRRGLVLFPVLSGPAQGLRFRFDLLTRMEVGQLLGTYEKKEMALAAEICQPGWTVWDCGIDMGYYTALFARLVGPHGRVIAIDADPRSLTRARDHVALNRFSNAQFIHSAIGAPLGQAEFILSDNTNSHLPDAYVGASREDYGRVEQIAGRIRVRCLSLDQVYMDEKIRHPISSRWISMGRKGTLCSTWMSWSGARNPSFCLSSTTRNAIPLRGSFQQGQDMSFNPSTQNGPFERAKKYTEL